MKKAVIVLLLLACLLMFVPVVAFAYNTADNGVENLFTNPDSIIKIDAQEEVVVYSCSETVTVYSVDSISAVIVDGYNEIAYSGIELDLRNYDIYSDSVKPESIPYIKDH